MTTADGGTVHLFDGLVVQQGPNYALAKTMQMWRAMQLREVHERVLSLALASCGCVLLNGASER